MRLKLLKGTAVMLLNGRTGAMVLDSGGGTFTVTPITDSYRFMLTGESQKGVPAASLPQAVLKAIKESAGSGGQDEGQGQG